MSSYRITKCKSDLLSNGKYPNDHWDSYFDIGKEFNGVILTEQEYCRIENNYISCITEILAAAGVRSLYIKTLEQYGKQRWKNQQRISINNASNILRDCFRETCWCRLTAYQAYVHFGYDYLVYIGVNIPQKDVELICKKYGLYCKKYPSPYSRNHKRRSI